MISENIKLKLFGYTLVKGRIDQASRAKLIQALQLCLPKAETTQQGLDYLSNRNHTVVSQLFLKGLFKTAFTSSRSCFESALSSKTLDFVFDYHKTDEVYLLLPHVVLHAPSDQKEHLVFHRDSLPSEGVLVAWFPLSQLMAHQVIRILPFTHYLGKLWELFFTLMPNQYRSSWIAKIAGPPLVHLLSENYMWQLGNAPEKIAEEDQLFFLGEALHAGSINKDKQSNLVMTHRYRKTKPSVSRYVQLKKGAQPQFFLPSLFELKDLQEDIQPYLNSYIAEQKNQINSLKQILQKLNEPLFVKYPVLAYFVRLFIDMDYPNEKSVDPRCLTASDYDEVYALTGMDWPIVQAHISMAQSHYLRGQTERASCYLRLAKKYTKDISRLDTIMHQIPDKNFIKLYTVGTAETSE